MEARQGSDQASFIEEQEGAYIVKELEGEGRNVKAGVANSNGTRGGGKKEKRKWKYRKEEALWLQGVTL